MFWGLVGATPSTVIYQQIYSSGATTGGVLEIIGLSGLSRATAENAVSASSLSIAINAALSGGFFTAIGANGNSTAPSGVTIAVNRSDNTGTSMRTLIMGYGATMYPGGNTKISITGTSNSNPKVGVANLILA
jgi:hypothetical protein